MRILLNEIKSVVILMGDSGEKQFYIDQCIGRGASCLVYHAKCDDNTEHLLKEYYPKSLSLGRQEDGLIVVPDGAKEDFEKGLVRFKSSCEKQKSVRLNKELKNFTCNVQGYYYGNGTTYVDMTCFAGQTYNKVQEKSIYDLARRMRALATVLGYYHEKGLLHLDIKPENILVRPESETVEDVMLFDFDSVTALDALKENRVFSYTKEWAALEQILARKWKDIGRATDIFAVGEIMFYQIFGRHSNDDERWSFARYHFDYDAKIFQNVNPRIFAMLDELFKHTISNSVINRYQNTNELCTQLEQIIKISDPKEPYIAKNLPAVQDFFVGRDKELVEIHKLFQTNNIIFLHGIGGIGKSELTKQYANRYKDEYDAVVFAPYINSIQMMMTDDSVFPIQQFQPYPKEKPEDYSARKLRKLQQLCDDRTLIIVDNFDRDDDEKFNILLKLRCKLLITTRLDFTEYGYYSRELKRIPDEKAVFEIFKKHYTKPLNKRSEEVVSEIIQLVDGHTMTVELLGKQMMAGCVTPETMMSKLKNSGINDSGKEKVRSSKDGTMLYQSTYDHIHMLFDLTKLNEDEKYILANLSLIPYTGISTELFCKWCEIESYDKINTLVTEGWVRLDKERDYISLHPVVSDVMKNNLLESDKYITKLLTHCLEDNGHNLLLNVQEEKRNTLINLLHSISVEIFKSQIESIKIARFLSESAAEYISYGNPEQAIKCGEKAYDIQIKLSDERYDEIAKIYENLGILYSRAGKFAKAEELLKSSLEIRLKLHGKNHKDIVLSYHRLGGLYEEFFRYETAEKYYIKALQISQKLYGKQHEFVAEIYSDLGGVHAALGRKYKYIRNQEKAEVYFKEALNIRIALYGERSSNVARTYIELGDFYRKAKELEKAKTCYNKALSVNMDKYDTALLYESYACLYVYAKKFERAEAYFKKVLNIFVELYGERHAQIAVTYLQLGDLYFEIGKLNKAKQYFLQALNINLQLYGEECQETSLSYECLGDYYLEIGDIKNAEKYLIKSSNIDLKLYGGKYCDTARTYEKIGAYLMKAGEYEKAEKYIRKSLMINLKLYGEKHYNTSYSYYCMGVYHKMIDNYESAKKYLYKASNIQKEVLGFVEPDVLNAIEGIKDIIANNNSRSFPRKQK